MTEGSSFAGESQSSGAFGLWMTLVIVLVLLGVAGAGSYALLQRITRQPTAADIAQRVCTAYTTQDYQLLINQIDPTPIANGNTLPNGISSTGPFDATAQNTLINTLKGLDASAGPVTSCQQHQLSTPGTSTPGTSAGASAGTLQFIFIMRRANTPNVTYSSVMNLVQHNGQWMVARDSNFVGTPG